ncbi:MAG: TRAP transporter small permease subunit [Lachnospiraceae bacterium]|nr:TRAP transporter small permease subunit [Lachnospiraceae bacterium]
MAKKIAHGYLKVLETICVCLLALILICMCIQIGCRLLSIGQNFTEELARIAFCLLVFIGMPLAFAEGADIAVDMVVNILPKPVQRAIQVLVNVLVTVFGFFCVRSLLVFTKSNQGVTAVSMIWIKMNWIYYAAMFSFICLSVIAVFKIVAVLRGEPDTYDINAEEKEKAKEEEVDLGI